VEITETTVGSLDVMSHGRALHFCNDVATADTYRYLPAFSIQGIRELLFVSDLKNHKIHQLDSTEGVYKDLVETGSGGLKRPYGLEVGPDGALYVASSGTNQILRYELPSGQFRGVWASVPGEPRGIRWHLDYLYVVSYYQKRVLRYKHHNSTWNPRAHEYGRHASYHHVFTQDMDQIVSRSAADIRSGGSSSERLSHPNDLQFHAIDGELKLFVTSAQQGIVFQFHGVTGTYERIFTDTKVNLASTLAFSHRPQNSNLFVSSPYSATAFVQFDGTTGKMKQQFMDPNLRRAKGMVILGDTMYVTNGYTLRKYDIDSGTILEDAITIPTSSLAGVTLNMKCGADYGHSTLDPDRDNKTPHGPLSHHYEIFSENYQ